MGKQLRPHSWAGRLAESMIYHPWHHRELVHDRSGNCNRRHSRATCSSAETHSCNSDRRRSRTMTLMGRLKTAVQSVGNQTTAKTRSTWANDEDFTRVQFGLQNHDRHRHKGIEYTREMAQTRVTRATNSVAVRTTSETVTHSFGNSATGHNRGRSRFENRQTA